MIDDIAKQETVEEAAVESAGNWRDWSNFVWFGSNDYPNSNNIMLGYTTGPQSTVVDEANHEVIAKALAPYMGMLEDPSKTVDNYGASFHGDMNSLKGFMIRVYNDDGTITESFQKLFELSREYCDGEALDDAVYQVANRKEMLRWINGEIPWLCEKHGVEHDDSMVVTLTDVLINEMCREYDHLDLDDLEEEFLEIYKAPTG